MSAPKLKFHQLSVFGNSPFSLFRYTNASTGYRWSVTCSEGLQILGGETICDTIDRKLGNKCLQEFRFQFSSDQAEKDQYITLIYHRVFEDISKAVKIEIIKIIRDNESQTKNAPWFENEKVIYK